MQGQERWGKEKRYLLCITLIKWCCSPALEAFSFNRLQKRQHKQQITFLDCQAGNPRDRFSLFQQRAIDVGWICYKGTWMLCPLSDGCTSSITAAMLGYLLKSVHTLSAVTRGWKAIKGSTCQQSSFLCNGNNALAQNIVFRMVIAYFLLNFWKKTVHPPPADNACVMTHCNEFGLDDPKKKSAPHHPNSHIQKPAEPPFSLSWVTLFCSVSPQRHFKGKLQPETVGL